MISGNLIIQTVPETLDTPGERAPITNNVVAPEAFLAEVVGQPENIAPLASGADAADIAAKVNELIAAFKSAGYMTPDWTITNTFDHITGSNTVLTAPDGTEYSTTLTADEGYTLPEEITVTMGGEEIAEGYTYVQNTGVLTITSVGADVEIIAVAEEEAEADPEPDEGDENGGLPTA